MSGSLKGTVGALSPEYTSGLIRADFSSPIHHNKGFMVVEGMDDVSFYGRYVIPNVKIYPAFKSETQGGGNNHVISVVEIVAKWEIGVCICGVIDADYRRFTKDIPTGDIFLTDHRDIEMTVLTSDSVASVMAKYDTSMRRILPVAKLIGIMRLCNAKYDLGVKFRNIVKRSMLFDEYGSLIYNWKGVLESAFWRNLPFRLKRHKIFCILVTWVMIKTGFPRSVSDSDICCGHDVLRFIAYAEKPSKSDKEIWCEICRSYSTENFEKTDLYHHIKTWYNKSSLL